MVNVTVLVEYPDEQLACDNGAVHFALSPGYGAATCREAHDLIARMWSSGVEPLLMLDANDEEWMFYRDTVRA